MDSELISRIRSDPRCKWYYGASTSQIAELEKCTAHTLPTSLVAYLREFGALTLDCEDLYGFNHRGLISIADNKKEWNNWAAGSVECYSSRIPVAEFGNGDVYCICCLDSAIYLHNHELEEWSKVSDSLEQFLSIALDCDGQIFLSGPH
jgi:hypothetical protein